MPWPGILTAGCEQNGWLAAVEKRIGCSFQEPTMTKFRGIFPYLVSPIDESTGHVRDASCAIWSSI